MTFKRNHAHAHLQHNHFKLQRNPLLPTRPTRTCTRTLTAGRFRTHSIQHQEACLFATSRPVKLRRTYYKLSRTSIRIFLNANICLSRFATTNSQVRAPLVAVTEENLFVVTRMFHYAWLQHVGHTHPHSQTHTHTQTDTDADTDRHTHKPRHTHAQMHVHTRAALKQRKNPFKSAALV